MISNPTRDCNSPQSNLLYQASSQTTQGSPVLFFKQCHTTFDAPNQRVSVFFDECNQEIIGLTTGLDSKTKVLIQATDRVDKAQFVLPVEKRILSIKFNISRTILAYHVEKSNVEFVNVIHTKDPSGQVSYKLDDRRYLQSSRTKNSKLFGFVWAGPSELVMITDISVEYYHIDPSRRRLRHEKTVQSSTNWFVYQPPLNTTSYDDGESKNYSLLMTSTGSVGNTMQPFKFCHDQMIKLHRFEVEGDWHGSDKLEMFERSITIAHIYDAVRLLVLQHESLNRRSKGAQILIYTINSESGFTTKTHTLDLDVNGRFAINILDNLVIAHDQPSRSSFIFDFMIESTQKSDFPSHYVSVMSNQPIKPLKPEGKTDEIEMYSLNWVFFQPNYVIDAKMGWLSTLHLDLEALPSSIQDRLTLLKFLANRTNSEDSILKRCREIIADSYAAAHFSTATRGSPLADVSSTFEILCKLIKSGPGLDQKSGDELQAVRKPREFENCNKRMHHYIPSISQERVYDEVLKQLETFPCDKTNTAAHVHFVTSTLFELIFLIRRDGKSVEFCIYEQLINCLVRNRRFYQLVQMIRSEILENSKQLACFLLSLRFEYKPAAQWGLDMLHRLVGSDTKVCKDIEHLLSDGHASTVISDLR